MKKFKYVLISLSILFALIGITIMVIFACYPPKNDLFSRYGTFIGGTVASLFTISGIIALYFNFYQQKEQFLRMSFENNYYKMIEYLTNHINSIIYKTTINGNEKIFKGIEAYRELANLYMNIYNNNKEGNYRGEIINKDNIGKIILKIYDLKGSVLNIIMENIKPILSLIDKNVSLNSEEKENYRIYLKNQIPNYLYFIIILFLIYYNENLPNYSILFVKNNLIDAGDFNRIQKFIIKDNRDEFKALFDERIKHYLQTGNL